MADKKPPRYIDIDLNFRANPATGDLVRRFDVDAVKSSIKNLIFTDYFERPFHQEIGSRLRNLLFEPIDEITTNEIRLSVFEVIKNFEPRAIVLTVDVQALPEQQEYRIEVFFQLVNTPEPVRLELFVERLR